MHQTIKILSLFFVLITTNLNANGNELKIRFIGNCGLHLTDGKINIYSDFPYRSGAYGYMKYDPAELDSVQENSIFLFTHKHADHFSGKNYRKVLKAKGGRKYDKWNLRKLTKLSEEFPALKVEVFKTKHRFSFGHYSYLITWHQKRIFLSGDTENAETIAEIKNLDWAFVPYWILLDAKKKELKIDTKMIGLYHLYPNQEITNGSPEKLKPLDNQGEIIRISY